MIIITVFSPECTIAEFKDFFFEEMVHWNDIEGPSECKEKYC